MCERGMKLFEGYMSTDKPKPNIEILKHTKMAMKPKNKYKFGVWRTWVWFGICEDEYFIEEEMWG